MEDPARVIICESKVPFVTGGAELHVENLAKAVMAQGLHTDVLTMPYEWDPPEKILKSCLLWRMLDLEETPTGRVDLLIATKFPTYAAKHYNKVAWVFHQHRSAYELEGTIYDDMSRHDGAREFRELISGLDRRFLGECRKVFATSENVALRLRKSCGVESEVLYHPPPYEGRYHSGEYGNDILIVGRLESLKRVDLAIQAMKLVREPAAKLRIIGRGFLSATLEQLAEKEGLSDRISFEGFVPDDKLLDMYADAACVLYVPFDEDYGYSTLEAFASSRPVITTDDSGGPLEFVKDGETGRVVTAKPAEVASAIDEMISERDRARKFGEAGRELIKDISWTNVMDKLVRPHLPC